MLLLLFACGMPDTENPLAVDDDGDGYTEFQGDLNDNDPTVYNGSDYIHKDDCPETIVKLDPTVLEVVCPTLPDINLSCPEPVVNIECPEPVVNLDCPEPVVNVAAPSVSVAAPDMSQIAAAIDYVGDAVLEMADAVDTMGIETRQYLAMGGYAADDDVVFTNNDSDGRTFIVTAINFGGQPNDNGLRVIKPDGSIVHPMAQYTPNISGYDSVGTGAAKMGNLTLPVAVGESIVMNITSCTNCTEEYYFQGYYTEMQ